MNLSGAKYLKAEISEDVEKAIAGYRK